MKPHYNLYYLFFEDKKAHPPPPEKKEELQKILKEFFKKIKPS